MSSLGTTVHGRDCVEPEVLAAYLDGAASLTERARVESHLASCPQCVAVIAGVVRTAEVLHIRVGADAAVTPRTGWRTLAGMSAAAAAVVAVMVAPSFWRPSSTHDAGLGNLAGTVGSERTVLGRLTGGLPHAPLGEPSAGGQDGRTADAARIVQAAGKIRESFGARETPARLHEMGVSQLLLRRYEDAVLSLSAASREQPDNAQYLSDLSAVQIERARLGLRPDDWPRALASADRARRIDPTLREAWFNRALAITALSLTDQARQAWAEYLARDGSSPWAAEARAQIDRLSQPTPASKWPGIEARLRKGVEAAVAEEAVRTQTTEARRYLETTLLPTWAAAVEAGQDSAPAREAARIMADAYLRVTTDALYHDTVAAIDRAESRGGDALLRLARAHRQYAVGAARYEANRFAEALPTITAAGLALRAEGSPTAIRADLDLGSMAYVGGRAADAERLLSATLTGARASGYGYAAARATRFLGMLAMGQGRMADAQALYEDTLTAFDRMGDTEQAALAHGLLVSLHFYLGDNVSAWRHVPQAASVMSISASPAVKYLQMTVAAAVIGAENPEAALALQETIIVNARDWGREAAVAEALTRRATTLMSMGRKTDAQADVAEARDRLSGIDPLLRTRIEVLVLASESALQREFNPTLAAATAARAIALVQGRGDRVQLARLNLTLAKAHIATGHLVEANAALEQGIQAFEAERASLSDEGRISTLDESWQLLETAVQLALEEKDRDRAFAMAERARATTLAEARRLPASESLKAIEQSLAPDQAIVALNQFEDSLTVWLIRATGTDVVVRPVSRHDARKLVGRQRDEIRLNAQTPNASATLYDEIVRPLAERLRGVSRIVIVPDAPYQGVAFAALWNTSTRRFLVEDATLSLATTASSLVTRVRQAQSPDNPQTPLVMGGLDEPANASARAVAAVYQSAELLTGASATAARFMADAPTRRVVQLSTPVAANTAYPLLSRVMFANAPNRPNSGAVMGREIAAQSFTNTNLVVLAGPAPDDREGDEGAPGMVRAFLTAGVPTVVGMLPGVDESTSRDLLVGFHRLLATGASPEQALTTYQRSVLKSNGGRLGAWSALVLYGSDR